MPVAGVVPHVASRGVVIVIPVAVEAAGDVVEVAGVVPVSATPAAVAVMSMKSTKTSTVEVSAMPVAAVEMVAATSSVSFRRIRRCKRQGDRCKSCDQKRFHEFLPS